MRVDFVAHHFGGDLRFFRHEEIAGAGAHDRDLAFAMNGAVAPDADRARKREVFGVRELVTHQLPRGVGSARVISTFGARSSSRSAMATICSGVLPLPKTTSGMP